MNRKVMGVAVAVSTLLSSVSWAAELQTIDHYKIEQTVTQSFLGLDTAEANGMLFATAFTTDGVLIDGAGKSYRGESALAAYARIDTAKGRELPKGPTNPVHFIANELIAATSYGAVSDVDILLAKNEVTADGGVNGGSANGTITATIHCRDELVKTPAGWRIRKRVLSAL